MFNNNISTGIFTTPTTSSTTLFDDVRTLLLQNATSTLTSEAHALLQHTFAKDWDQPLSITPHNDAATSSATTNFLSPKALTNTISPTLIFGEQVDLDFGENTLDWVSSLYNKLPNNEVATTENDYLQHNYRNANIELNFNGLRKLSIHDRITEEEEGEHDSKDNVKATIITCLQCGYVATNRKQLWRHGKRENHITRDSSIKSETSGRKFSSREIHEHQCDLCPYTSKSRFNVLRHFQRVHINEKSTACDQCDKQFKDIDTLKTHIRYTHNTERRFPCDACEKQFVSSSDLQRHRKIVHDKIRNYLCQKCGKNFPTQSNAKRHFLEVCSGNGSSHSKASDAVNVSGTKESEAVSLTYKVQLPTYETE